MLRVSDACLDDAEGVEGDAAEGDTDNVEVRC